MQAAFPPGVPVVNRYNVKRRRRGEDSIPGRLLALSVGKVIGFLHRYILAEHVKRFSV